MKLKNVIKKLKKSNGEIYFWSDLGGYNYEIVYEYDSDIIKCYISKENMPPHAVLQEKELLKDVEFNQIEWKELKNK